MPSEFSNQLPLSNKKFDLLPLFHTCDCFEGRRHVRASSIITKEDCEVFKDQITYLFYGRPAFKYQLQTESSRDLSLYPISFVFNTDAVRNIKRIFPFDSGAMHHGRYKTFFNPRMNVLDFEIEPSTARIKDIVLHFYGTNSRYLDFKQKAIKNQSSDFEAHSFSEMIRSISSSSADERRATIEVQAAAEIKLNSDSLKAVIIPTGLREDQLFKDFCAKNSVLISSYDIATWNPALSFSVVQNTAKNLINKLRRK